MSEEKKQAVVDDTDDQTKDTASQSDSEGSDARGGDDLENLLDQWDKQDDKDSDKQDDKSSAKTSDAAGSSKSDAGQQPGTDSDPNQQVLEKLEQFERERREARERELRAQAEKDMEGVVGVVRGDLDAETFDYDFVESWISAQARKDQRIERAWHDRHKSPKQFERLIEGLGKQFANRFEALPDKKATEDREAVTAAVRGASNKAPEKQEPEYKSLSDKDFADQVEKEHGFRPF